MKDATAPTRASLPRRAAISRPASKSSEMMRTGTPLAARYRRQEGHLVAVAYDGVRAGDIMVDSHAHGTSGRKLARPGVAPRAQGGEHVGDRRRIGQVERLAALAEGVA